MNKKDFQTTIKEIREQINLGNYPKAIMAASQIEKRTATVNCGFEHGNKERIEKRITTIINHKSFISLLERNNAKAVIEYSGNEKKQIRINW